MLDTYEICSCTCAVISVNENMVKIIERDKEFYVETSSYKIIDNSCMYYGSSYIGRNEGSKNMLTYSYKLPIIVEETKPIIFFPISSPKYSNCTWISLQNIDKILKNTTGSKVLFKGGREVEFGCSNEIIENQVVRSTQLKCILFERQRRK